MSLLNPNTTIKKLPGVDHPLFNILDESGELMGEVLNLLGRRTGVNIWHSERTDRYYMQPITWKEDKEYFGEHDGRELLLRAGELPAASKVRAADTHRYWNVEDTEWWEWIYEDYTQILEESGFMAPDIYFSGFYSQGDGASFVIKSFDIEKFLSQQPDSIKHHFRHLKRIADYIEVSIYNVGGSTYSHENTKRVSAELDLRFAAHDTPKLLDLIKKFESYVELIRVALSRKIYKSLETEYEWRISDEQVIESLDCNGYLFHRDGSDAQ